MIQESTKSRTINITIDLTTSISIVSTSPPLTVSFLKATLLFSFSLFPMLPSIMDSSTIDSTTIDSTAISTIIIIDLIAIITGQSIKDY